ncbi:hypothetical protein BDB01DRAFT_853048 [Pilobolus umbonatus]|nr:hypothetical protein BDB01DRAFT_853048 [Pilobolus umbonatus]
MLLNRLKSDYDAAMVIVEHLIQSVTMDTITMENMSLTEDGQGALRSLTLLAQSMGIGTTRLNNYLTAISRLTLDSMDNQHQQTQLDEIEYALDEWHKGSLVELETMTKLLDHLQHQPEQKKERITMSPSDYVTLQNKYNQLGIEKKGISLKQIFELEKKVHSIESELQHKLQLMSNYKDLPPDMVLTSIKVQEIENELHELEQERENGLAVIAHQII